MHAHRLSSHRSAQLAAHSARMRRQPTPSEARLWESLRCGQLGVTFRRPARLGEVIADFAAYSVRLVVEVDGAAHVGRERADGRRDRELGRLGFTVLRLDAGLVMRDTAVAVALVRQAITALR